MPSTRTPSIADLFVGGNKLRDLFEMFGMGLTDRAGIEKRSSLKDSTEAGIN
jgi:hypothetical protein